MAKRRRKKKPAKGVDLSKEEKIRIAQEVCELYATDQYTLEECLAQAGIRSDSTWYKWRSEIEEIEKLYEDAKIQKAENYRINLVGRARTTLERYLDGFTVELNEQEGHIDEKGNLRIDKVKQKKVYVKPSMRAVEFVLTNMDGKNFTRFPEPTKAVNEQLPGKITIEIEGKRIEPITSEDDINEDID